MNSKLIRIRESVSPAVKSVVAGDFCPREQNSEDTAQRAAEITSEVKPYFEDAHLRILQWECTVTQKDTPIAKCGPNHRCYAPAVAFADSLNIDCVLLANNHTGDYGPEGVLDTINTFAEHKIATVGAGMDQAQAEKVFETEIDGLSIAVINAAEHEFGISSGDKAGAAGLDIIRIANEIRTLKQDHDIVMVTLHGSHEHYAFPSPRLKQMCRFFADCGASGVFNCHSHCPVGYEIYQGVPIIYSPGNFYFPPRPTSGGSWFIGYVPKFYFDKQGAFALEILPYYNYKSRVAVMDEADSQKFFKYMDELCAPIGDDTLLKEYFDAWSIISGFKGYLNTLRSTPPDNDFEGKEKIAPWLVLRNIFTCEAHHDLLRNCLYMIESGSVPQAGKYVDLVKSFQNPEWVKKEF